MRHNPEVWQKKKLRQQCKSCSKLVCVEGRWCKEFLSFESAFCYLKGHDCGYRQEEVRDEKS